MRYLLLLCCAGLIFGQGTETKPKVEDYQVHGQVNSGAIGAEFMVRSYSRGEQVFIAKDYLVVEAAIFPPKGTTFDLQHNDFCLRINGKKELLEAVAPTMVLSDMQHPEMKPENGGLHAQAGGSLGNAGVVFGGPPVNNNPFPGGLPPQNRLPPPVEIPRDNPSGVTKEPLNPAEVLLWTALVDGPHQAVTSGFLFFPFRGRVTSIKTLELLYQDAVLKLR